MLGALRVGRYAAVAVLGASLSVGLAGQALEGGPGGASGPVRTEDLRAWMAQQAVERERVHSRERRLIVATERMAVLAGQLQDAVGKDVGKTVSAEAMRQADEMERLAREVKKALKE